ncbi:hypothetical protein BJ165DRAFT_348047 [Panaeolus papilionaceus]|nr:hypothetical protein BJ165DRAFT_348047 [Panaeolus papilionaceus]
MCPHIFFTLATSIILIYSQYLATTLTNSMVSQAFLSRRETSDPPLRSPHQPTLDLTSGHNYLQCQKIVKQLQNTLNTLKAFSDTLYGPFLFGDIRGLINLLDRQTTLLEVRLELLTPPKLCSQHGAHCAPPLSGESEPNNHRCQVQTCGKTRRRASWPHLSHHMHYTSSKSFTPTPVPDETWNPHSYPTRQGCNSGRGGVIGGIHLNVHNGGNVNGMKSRYDYMEVEDYSNNDIS